MSRNGKIAEHVAEFLPTLRMGIDLGEFAGGLALARGNDVLHAETFVDVHEPTLEKRRMLRRNRRTRSARKRRLALLRSWLLRQEIPAPVPGARKTAKGKTTLPDPYALMGRKEYQTLPGFFRVKGRRPDVWRSGGAKTWERAAQAGETDAGGFVIALTHIFSKRGFDFHRRRGLDDYSDKALETFLAGDAEKGEKPCSLGGSREVYELFLREIEHREKEKAGDDGEIKRNEKLRAALEAANRSGRQPRMALPREVRETDLQAAVDGFAKRWKLDGKTSERWKRELTGLLNRVIRPARFENRLRSGCSWCGANTPRLKKTEIRETALRAAVGNIRARDANTYEERPLTDEEKAPFLDWFGKRRENFKDWSRKKTAPWAERTPSEKTLEAYLREIGVPEKWFQDKKRKWKKGFGMLPQLNDLVNRPPKGGRARLCMKHMKMQADGKTMEDAGLNWQTLRIRNAPNPKREQKDARVLKRIERLLFVPGKKGEEAWRYGPVSFINMEVPIPEDLERARKKELTTRKPLTLRERLHAETGGVCIYCGEAVSAREMEMEHIVSRARGGPDVQMNRVAACKRCNHPSTGKGENLPSEWLRGADWEKFKTRVEGMEGLPEFKKMMLMLPPGESYPDDPTPLARVGARWRAFAADIALLFERYGLEKPTLHYEKGKPFIQVIRGGLTAKLRRSWRYKDGVVRDGKPWSPPAEENFPEKEKSDLYNHAQDAALVAAIPPHTWRNQAMGATLARESWKRDANGVVQQDKSGKDILEWKPIPGMAMLELAPDWAAFEARRKAKPFSMVHVLRRNAVNWKSKLVGESLYQEPGDLDGKYLKIRKPLDSPGPNGQRRKTEETQKRGLVVAFPHDDGTSGKRKLGVEPGCGSVAAVVWRDPNGRKGNVNISLERPKPLWKFLEHPVEPPIPKDAEVAGRLARGETKWLPADEKIPAGFYRVKELASGGIIVIPENALTDELAQGMGIPKEERKTPPERKLGKRELWELLRK